MAGVWLQLIEHLVSKSLCWGEVCGPELVTCPFAYVTVAYVSFYGGKAPVELFWRQFLQIVADT